MINIIEYIESGILELYVIGELSISEMAEVEAVVANHEEIRAELQEISEALEIYAQHNSFLPSPLIRPLLLATIDFSERIKNGEVNDNPPVLNEKSTIQDFAKWLDRPDMILPVDFKEIHVKIIGHSPKVITAIVWIKDGAPQEVHSDVLEKFLIIEGSCNIIIEDDVHQLTAGDFFSIPLYKKHYVDITSSILCKIILQRIAA